MSSWIYLLYVAVFLLLVLLVPPLIKRYYYQRLMQDLESHNFTLFTRHLDSFLAKVTFSAFERESMRLSMYEMRHEMKKADEQVQFMENMRLSRKQKAQLGERGFYVYLESGKIKKARHMMELVEQYGSELQAKNLQIQYSILLKKESKYIPELQERHARLKNDQGQIPANLNNQAGTFEYLIGLQYSYLKDKENMRKWLSAAQEHLKNTPYEDEIEVLLKA